MPRKKAKLDIEENTSKTELDINSGAEIRVHDNRLANFTNPLARSYPPKVKDAKLKTKLSKGQRSLVGLMDFPVELFLEIAANLEPIDILHFSRVSTHFRSLFNPKNSRHVWIAARRNIPGLPDCPPDLTEAQYASLVFENTCQACGVKTVKVDYCLRLKFCTPCFQMNISKGAVIAKASQLGKIPSIVYKLLPRTTAKYIPQGRPYTSASNTYNHTYYAPELCLIVKRYRSLEHDKEALGRFIEQQQMLATQLMESGKVLLDWDAACRRTKHHEKMDIAASRKKSIEAKLIEVGWNEESFPNYWESHEWEKLVSQPRELTPRIWAQISPKLFKILEKVREKRLETARLQRVQLRSNEFSLLWGKHLLSYPPEERDFLPNRSDAVLLPSVSVALNEDDGNATVTSERFNTILLGALVDSEQYKIKVQSDLLKALDGPNALLEPHTATDEKDNHVRSDPLYQVSAIFSCGRCWPIELLTFPNVLSHSHIRGARWTGNIRAPGPEVRNLALEILRIFELPAGTLHSSEAFKKIDGRFVCNCGSRTANDPLDFMSLLKHIFKSNQWHKTVTVMATGRKRGLVLMKEPPQKFSVLSDLHDDHAIEHLASLLSLAPPDTLEPSLDTPQEASSDCIGSCVICTDLTGKAQGLTQEQITYHMNAKHHIYEGVLDMVHPNVQPGIYAHELFYPD